MGIYIKDGLLSPLCLSKYLEKVNELISRLYSSSCLLLNLSRCPNGVRIVGRWCSTPCTEAKETLAYIPI